jgi:hypothetical protein
MAWSSELSETRDWRPSRMTRKEKAEKVRSVEGVEEREKRDQKMLRKEDGVAFSDSMQFSQAWLVLASKAASLLGRFRELAAWRTEVGLPDMRAVSPSST